MIEAVKNREPEAAIFLIDKGADPFIKNNKGEIAISSTEYTAKERWADFVIDGAKRIIEKIKSHREYKDFEKTQKASGVD